MKNTYPPTAQSFFLVGDVTFDLAWAGTRTATGKKYTQLREMQSAAEELKTHPGQHAHCREAFELLEAILKRLDLEPVEAVFPCSALRGDIRALLTQAQEKLRDENASH